MDKYKYIKGKLRKHEQNKIYLEKLEKDLSLLEEERELKGIFYDDIGGGKSGNISDLTGRTASWIADKEVSLRFEIKKVKNDIEHIEKILNSLLEEEKAAIVGIYIKEQEYWTVAKHMNVGTSTVKRRRREGFEKIKAGMFGNVN